MNPAQEGRKQSRACLSPEKVLQSLIRSQDSVSIQSWFFLTNMALFEGFNPEIVLRTVQKYGSGMQYV